jgi:hypothetical protein
VPLQAVKINLYVGCEIDADNVVIFCIGGSGAGVYD